jgi:hypothetical protein
LSAGSAAKVSVPTPAQGANSLEQQLFVANGTAWPGSADFVDNTTVLDHALEALRIMPGGDIEPKG